MIEVPPTLTNAERASRWRARASNYLAKLGGMQWAGYGGGLLHDYECIFAMTRSQFIALMWPLKDTFNSPGAMRVFIEQHERKAV